MLRLIADHSDKVDGIKVSLLDDVREVRIRQALPDGVRLYTGDDFNYPAPDRRGKRRPARGLRRDRAGRGVVPSERSTRATPSGFERMLDPTLPLARKLFARAHLALQDGHRLPRLAQRPSGAISAWSAAWRARAPSCTWPTLFRLAAGAGLLVDPPLAAGRMRRLLAVGGIDVVSRLDPTRLSFNEITADHLSLEEAVEACAAAGIGWFGPWRHKLSPGAPERIRHAGLRVSSLCRGGFFPATNAAAGAERDRDNRTAVEEAAELGTDVLVLVCGPALDGELDAARRQVLEGIETLLPHAAAHGVRLGIEPLHPMMIAERSVVVTLAQALELAERFDAARGGRGHRRLSRLVGPRARAPGRARGGPHRRLPRVRLALPDPRRARPAAA